MDPRPDGTPCVCVRLGSNNISSIRARAFKKLPHLRALDLSTNHLARFALSAKATPRLMTLALRNNRLTDLAPLGELAGLRQLDVSFNSLEGLRGLEKLVELRVLLANGNQLNGSLPAERCERCASSTCWISRRTSSTAPCSRPSTASSPCRHCASPTTTSQRACSPTSHSRSASCRSFAGWSFSRTHSPRTPRTRMRC